MELYVTYRNVSYNVTVTQLNYNKNSLYSLRKRNVKLKHLLI